MKYSMEYNRRYNRSCFCNHQSTQAGFAVCIKCALPTPKPPSVKNSILPKIPSATDTREVQALQGHPPKSCQHLLLWADTLISCLFCVCQGGAEGTPWILQAAPPLPLRSPAPPFSRPRKAEQLLWVWLPSQLGGRGALWGSPGMGFLEAPPGWALGTWQERDRAVPGARIPPAASPQLPAKISSVTSILWHLLLLLWCIKSNKSPVRS